MSRLIQETNEYLIFEEYVTHDSDTLPEWAFDRNNQQRFSDDFIMAAEGILYEMNVRVKVDKESNTAEIVYIQSGTRKLT